jgi:PhoH-like ATPase
MQKIFVLDTNVLLHNPDSIESFADNLVYVPITAIEELDKFKKESTERGRNARAVIRKLDELRKNGALSDGVPLANGGQLKIVVKYDIPADMGLDSRTADNRILMLAYMLHKQGKHKVIFVTKDIHVRIKSDALGIETMDFEKQKVDFDKLYAGWQTITCSEEKYRKYIETGEFDLKDYDLCPNEFVYLTSQDLPDDGILTRHNPAKKTLKRIEDKGLQVWGIEPKSVEQRIAFQLLLDPAVQLITLVGKAGTGKTLLALTVGLHKVLDAKKYDKMLISRPIMPMGRDIGYLPGTKEEKLEHWMEPIFDNLEFIIRTGKAGKRKTIYDYFDAGVIEMEALTYIRGRSLPHQYIIIDEAQNLTPHEVKTVISRAGYGTKIILTGDPYQIDNPYLDASSTGLNYAVERMKKQPLHGHITLMRSERSPLAAIAAELL